MRASYHRTHSNAISDRVGVDLIAENAGLKGPSLYRHYKGKEDIFFSLIDMVESHYTKGFGLKNTEVGFPESMEVFCKYDAPEYSEEGICEFRKSLDDPERTRKLIFYGAFDGDQLVGTLCMREPQHIGGFFVKGNYHKKGIGRSL